MQFTDFNWCVLGPYFYYDVWLQQDRSFIDTDIGSVMYLSTSYPTPMGEVIHQIVCTGTEKPVKIPTSNSMIYMEVTYSAIQSHAHQFVTNEAIHITCSAKLTNKLIKLLFRTQLLQSVTVKPPPVLVRHILVSTPQQIDNNILLVVGFNYSLKHWHDVC